MSSGIQVNNFWITRYVLNCWAATTARIKYSSKISVKYVYPSLSNMKLMHVRHLSFDCFPHTNEKCILSLINKLELCKFFLRYPVNLSSNAGSTRQLFCYALVLCYTTVVSSFLMDYFEARRLSF